MDKNDILDTLRDFRDHFAEKYGIIKIGIFGSVARDELHEDSDLDICIITASPNPFILVHIKEEIEKRVNRKCSILFPDATNKTGIVFAHLLLMLIKIIAYSQLGTYSCA